MSVLEGLEGDVTKTLQSIQKGIALLDDRRAELMSAPVAVADGSLDATVDPEWDDQLEDASAHVRQ